MKTLSVWCALAIVLVTACAGEVSAAVTRYSHDVAAGTTTVTDPNNKQLRYRFDPDNNLTSLALLSEPGTPTFHFSYDLTDQLDDMSYPGGRATGIDQDFSYDTYDRLSSLKDYGNEGALLETRFDYDHQDRLTWITYPDNTKVCYQYDADGRLTRVGRAQASYSVQSPCTDAAVSGIDYHYDAKGRLIRISRPNGVSSFIEYEADTGRVARSGHQRGTTLIFADRYDYYPQTSLIRQVQHEEAGNPTTVRNYSYDARGRLAWVGESATGRSIEYDYDALGNRTEENISCPSGYAPRSGEKACGRYVYSYSPGSSRLSAIHRDGQLLEQFSYDGASGRIRTRTAYVNGVGKTTTYSWEGRGYLSQVQSPEGPTTRFAYDGRGVRKSKSVTQGGVTISTYYVTASVFGLPQVLMEYQGSTKQRSYIYGGTQVLFEEDPSGAKRYALSEGTVGSVTHHVDGTGNVTARYEYEAFGQPVGGMARIGFTGERQDSETGLVYLRARYYDPSLGRFISADPFWGYLEEPASQNRYTYVGNNPLSFVGPFGLDSLVADNGTLTHYNDSGNVVGTYPYTTGKDGVTDPSVPWQGPIPPGNYSLDPSQISEGGFLRNLLGASGSYDVKSDSHYAIRVEFQSGKKLQKEAGYVTNGMDFQHEITVSDSDIKITDSKAAPK